MVNKDMKNINQNNNNSTKSDNKNILVMISIIMMNKIIENISGNIINKYK